ncbi:MAG: serine/threonine-protein kinase [Kofleriaceae bacterium]
MREPERPELAATFVDPSEPTVDRKSPPRADSMGDTVRLSRGSTIGRYLVLDVLGAGGMGIVYTAYDPQLDRKVALKLVRSRSRGAALGARMLREAQAIARISHPNVVAVHDVGTMDDLVFIAMELITGDTLGSWLRVRTRTLAEILTVFDQAGRGLAAAHSSGLVHRDFKPDNVLVGWDGRARVVDFGLVHGIEGASSSSDILVDDVRASDPLLETRLTQVGAMMGTPHYMAPEQLLVHATDARSDQYSFCVSLHEALAGEVPYGGAHLDEIKAKVLAGNPPELPAARKVPPHLAAAIRRGLSVAPAGRWPSMTALLDELGRDPTARRRRWIAGAGISAMIGLAIAIPLIARRDAAASPCGGVSAQLAAIWNPARKQQMQAAFAATGATFADAAFRSAARQLDAYATRWATSHEDSCKATHTRHEQSLDMLDLRTACLQRRRTELAALIDVLLEPDSRAVQRAHVATAALSPVEDCSDLVALQSPVKLPSDEPSRVLITQLREELARLQALYIAAHYQDGSSLATTLVARATALGYRPVEAEAQQLLGLFANRVADPETALHHHVAGLAAATASHHDELSVRILISLVMVSSDQQLFERAHDWATLADAVVERMGNPPLRRAHLHYALGYMLGNEGKFAAAAEHYEKALATRERLAPGSQEVARALNGLAHSYDEIGRYADGRRMGERSLALQQAELGPEHPEIATVLTNLGNIATDEGDLTLAKNYYTRALVIRERTAVGADQLLLSNVINNLGVLAYEEQRYADAIVLHRRALAIRQKAPSGKADVAMSLANIASNERKLGNHALALDGYQKSLEIAERELGRDHPYVGDALQGIGECQWSARQFAASRTALERALTIRRLGARPVEIADVEIALARTLWDGTPRDRPRALALARSARAALAGSPATAGRLTDVDAWLATHR